MKPLLILLVLLLPSFQRDTPASIGTPGVNTDYFWNYDRTVKLSRSKSTVLTETIKNGYYAKKEYLTFVDKKLSSIKYIKDGDTATVSTLTNGNGYLIKNFRDTIYIKNGKLNGKSFFYSYYPLNIPTVKNQKINMSTDLQRYIMDFKDNFLKSMLVYRKGILIYESYFKKYDYIKENLDKKKDNSCFQDSILKVYNADGSLRSTFNYKNGYVH